MIIRKSPSEIEAMRRAGHVVAEVLDALRQAVHPGVTTAELDELAASMLHERGAKPSFKGYNGYPACLCTSVDNEVVHGIPSSRRLEAGQIVGLDFGAQVDGFHGDSAITVPVGEISTEARKLLSVTRAALYRGIEKARAGNHLHDVSAAIQQFVESQGFSVVRDYGGHGIGRDMHEDPHVPNFGTPGHGPALKPGMTLAIEPMVNAGRYEVIVRPDRWTLVTADSSLSAHFEHTVLITDGEPEILTLLGGKDAIG